MVHKIRIKRPAKGFRVGKQVTVKVPASDADGDPLVYRFVFGDGTSVVTDKRRVRHTYSERGRYVVKVLAYDGEEIDRRSKRIKVKSRR